MTQLTSNEMKPKKNKTDGFQKLLVLSNHDMRETYSFAIKQINFNTKLTIFQLGLKHNFPNTHISYIHQMKFQSNISNLHIKIDIEQDIMTMETISMQNTVHVVVSCRMALCNGVYDA